MKLGGIDRTKLGEREMSLLHLIMFKTMIRRKHNGIYIRRVALA